MKIPKQVTVGKTKIKIDQPVSLMVDKTGCRGSFDRSDNSIDVAKKDVRGNSYSAGERSETFWHETTHAILAAMGRHKLNNDEKFVTEFAKLLDEAVHTATFD